MLRKIIASLIFLLLISSASQAVNFGIYNFLDAAGKNPFLHGIYPSYFLILYAELGFLILLFVFREEGRTGKIRIYLTSYSLFVALIVLLSDLDESYELLTYDAGRSIHLGEIGGWDFKFMDSLILVFPFSVLFMNAPAAAKPPA
jgi:hypothetical protein